jgi:hypothetical protein
MNRRAFLASATAATAAAGAVWYAYDGKSLYSKQDGPYSAWKEWDGPADPPLKLIRSAVLASSPHNTQPWRFRVTKSSIELFLDSQRSVAGLDPFLREAHIGMGCALENLALAAQANNFTAAISLSDATLKNSTNQPLRLVAKVDLAPGPRQETELYNAIPKRHTNRGPYDPNGELPPGFGDELLSISTPDQSAKLFLFSDPVQRRELTRISSAANLELYSDDEVENGSNQWIRWRSADISTFEDGLTIDNFGLSPVMTAVAKAAPTFVLKQAAAPSHRTSMYEQQMLSARIVGIIGVRDRLSTSQSLTAGRLWQRAHLLATVRGVAARPCNEAIEMIDYELQHTRRARRLQEISRVIGDPDWQPTFLFLMGKPTLDAHLSPRRPAKKVTLGSA